MPAHCTGVKLVLLLLLFIFSVPCCFGGGGGGGGDQVHHHHHHHHHDAPPPPTPLLEEVELDGSSNSITLQEILQRGQPVVVRRFAQRRHTKTTAPRAGRVFVQWSTSLRHVLERLDGDPGDGQVTVLRNRQRLFTHFGDGDYSRAFYGNNSRIRAAALAAGSVDDSETKRRVKMPVSALLRELEHQHQQHSNHSYSYYHYIAKNMVSNGTLAHGTLAQEAQALTDLLTASLPRRFEHTPGNRQVWFSQGGCVTQAHVDFEENLLLQVQGHKRVTLYPPSDADALHLYPLVHPGWKQVQPDIAGVSMLRQRNTNNTYSAFPLLKRLLGNSNSSSKGKGPRFVVTLAPGDLLYLPQLWFHQMEVPHSTPASLSYNVWFDEPKVQAHDLAVQVFRDGFLSYLLSTTTTKTTWRRLVRPVAQFFRDLAELLWPGRPAYHRLVLRRLYDSRYRPLLRHPPSWPQWTKDVSIKEGDGHGSNGDQHHHHHHRKCRGRWEWAYECAVYLRRTRNTGWPLLFQDLVELGGLALERYSGAGGDGDSRSVLLAEHFVQYVVMRAKKKGIYM